MAKNVFRPTEITNITANRVVLDTPYKEVVPVEVVAPAEEYAGPTADDLRREAEAFRDQWEQEKAELISSANEEAENIVKDAEERAFQVLKNKTDEGEKIRQDADDQAARSAEADSAGKRSNY